MCLPLKNLYSGKYLIPLICCLLWLLARSIRHRRATEPPPKRWPARVGAAGLVVMLSFFVTPTPDASTPNSTEGLLAQPRAATTHDGMRSAGAYVQLIGWFHSREHRPPYIGLYLYLTDLVEGCNNDVTIHFPVDRRRYVNDPWTWGWLPLHLASTGWRLEKFAPVDEVRMVSPAGQALRMLSAQQAQNDAGATAEVIDLAPARVLPGEDEAAAVLAHLKNLPPRPSCTAQAARR